MSKNKPGIEMRAAAWLVRHPQFVAAPASVATSLIELGPYTTGGIAAGLALSGVGWMRAHPASFHRHAAPRLRSGQRRWIRYHGRRWRSLCLAVDLFRENRRTGELHYPRVLRVTSPTPTIDRVTVRLTPGQSLRTWTDRQDEIAVMLNADALGITRIKPQVIVLTVLRGNPFAHRVLAAEIPEDAEAVNLHAIEFGETEYGATWTEPVQGQNVLVSGGIGSGKSSFIWNPLRGMGPMIRDGLVRVWMCDLKGGQETSQARSLFYRWADHVEEPEPDEDGNVPEYAGEAALDVVRDFRDAMTERQRDLATQGIRKVEISPEYPLNVLMIDELAMATALSSRSATNELNKLLAEIMTQNRSTGFPVLAYVQEPTKDIVPIRGLFTRRVCLACTAASYVDMTLGDDMRLRGALADEIPLDEEHAGIGFRVDERSRNPIRVRGGYNTDEDIDELVRTCSPAPSTGRPRLTVAA
ncbi:MAG TPA: cell division protein FtsK [Pseudonocardiaceae bacterium]|jgi:S-DNA-T family DNA segregation ATPase FtsK/SpoIIIE|nr:cell division protein FtsK [Pseudonocardiaceae bacterium]